MMCIIDINRAHVTTMYMSERVPVFLYLRLQESSSPSAHLHPGSLWCILGTNLLSLWRWAVNTNKEG